MRDCEDYESPPLVKRETGKPLTFKLRETNA